MEIKEFVLEGNEFIGIKAGQDYYQSIRSQLSPDINKLVFAEDADVRPAWIRGFMGIRDDNLYISMHSSNPELDEHLEKWSHYFEGIHGDKEAIDFSPKKKKK